MELTTLTTFGLTLKPNIINT